MLSTKDDIDNEDDLIGDKYGLKSWYISDWCDDIYSQGTWSVPKVSFNPLMRKRLEREGY